MISPCELFIQNTSPKTHIPRITHVCSIRSSYLPFFPQYFLNIRIYIYIYVYICNQSFLMMSSFIPLSLSHCPHLTLAQRHVAPAQIRRCWRNVRGYLAPAPHSPASPGHLGFSKRGDQVIYQAPSKKKHRKRCPKLENPNFEIAICSWCVYMFLYVSIFLVGCKMDSVVCPLDSCQWVIVINEW